jgi:Flp pilus assembly protein CpaB
MVSAPVRIADASTVRLLHPGDRVDVIASTASSTASSRVGGREGEAPRIVAPGARVASIPRESQVTSGSGALIVLSVPRATATALAGASATSQLAVSWC